MPHPTTITVEHSVEIQWEAEVSLEGDVDPPRLALGPSQARTIRALLGAYFAGQDTGDEATAELVRRIMVEGLDARDVRPPSDEDFCERADEDAKRQREDMEEDDAVERWRRKK